MPTASAQGPDEFLAQLPEPWERLVDESTRAYAAFVHYRDLDPEIRSIPRAVEAARDKNPGKHRGKIETQINQAERWSSAHLWRARAEAWDQMLERRRVEGIIEARHEMGLRHVSLVDRMLETALAVFAEIKPGEISVSDAIKLADTAVKLGRLVTGDVTSADLPDDPTGELSPQEQVRAWLADPEVAKAGARFGAQVLRAQREQEAKSS